MQKIFSKWVQRYFSNEEAILLFVLLFTAALTIWYLGSALIPVFASLILAFMMQGGLDKLRDLGVGHKTSAFIVFALFTGVVAALFLIILPLVWTQLVNLFNELPRMAGQLQKTLMLLPEAYPQFITAEQIRSIIGGAASEASKLGQWVFNFSLNSLTGVLTVLIYFVLVPMLVLFFLLDGDKLIKGWTAFLPDHRPVIRQVWAEMDMQLANYIRGKAIEIVIVGVATYIAFVILDINYAALLALAVGLSVLIPYIGAAIVTLPVALIAFFQWGWSDQFIYLMVAYTIIQAIDGNVIVPLLFSEAVNLHPVSIIVSVLVFGSLWGFWGVFFAIPLATLVKSIVNAWPKSEDIPPLA